MLQRLLQGAELDEPSRLLLGDWCWARGTELAIEYELPFKIHTGYYAGNDRMPVDRIKSGNQEACFDLAGTRQALRASAAG